MRMRLFIGVSLIAILAGYWYFSQKVQVEVVLVAVQKKNFSKKELDLPYVIAGNINNVNRVLFQWLGDSFNVITNVSFLKNDYIMTFGKPIKEARYYKHIPLADDCGYLPEIPLNISYQNSQTDSIYFYKIEKGKYRDICSP